MAVSGLLLTLTTFMFNLNRTLYVLVVLALLVFALFNLGLALKLAGKWRRLH